MKDTILNIVKDIFGYIFSGFTLFILAAGLFIYIIIGTAESERAEREKRRAATELCYNAGMVLVDTDAGPRCAAPQNLARIK